MNTNQVCQPRFSKPLPVRLDPMPVDERAVYIDSICAVLIESRFGPGRSLHRFEVHYSEYPESVVDLDVLCDLINNDPFHPFMASPAAEANKAGRRGRSRVSSPHVSKGSPPNTQTHDQTLSPSTHARGSP